MLDADEVWCLACGYRYEDAYLETHIDKVHKGECPMCTKVLCSWHSSLRGSVDISMTVQVQQMSEALDAVMRDFGVGILEATKNISALSDMLRKET